MKLLTSSLWVSLLSLLSTSYAGESIHLSNCYSSLDTGAVYYSSEIEYYPDDSSSSSGLEPPSSDICETIKLPSSGWTAWAGNAVSCTFSSGVRVTANIDSDGQSVPVFSGCGWVTNGFENFNCFRDDDHDIYSVDFGDGTTTCESFYYCFPA